MEAVFVGSHRHHGNHGALPRVLFSLVTDAAQRAEINEAEWEVLIEDWDARGIHDAPAPSRVSSFSATF